MSLVLIALADSDRIVLAQAWFQIIRSPFQIVFVCLSHQG